LRAIKHKDCCDSQEDQSCESSHANVANRKRICYLALMQVRSCRVTTRDIDGMSHSVDVTAATLFEAVAQAIAALRRDTWVVGIPGGLNVVHVSVASVHVDHEVKMADFERWLEKPGGSPREIVERQRIRAILGMEVSR
jgi:hypothetical protein